MENFGLEDLNIENKVIEIYESKMKNVGVLFLALLLVVASIYLGIYRNKIDIFTPLISIIFSVVGTVVFIVAIVYSVKNLFKREPVLIFNKDGYYNKYQSYSEKYPFICWKDVKDISMGEVASTKLICIEIENEEEYVESMDKNVRFGAKTNIKMGFPAITLSAKTLKGVQIDDLFGIFAVFYGNYNGNLEIIDEEE
ncbi:STM3941 family protein [Miniphocaeibacter massiliensis]|uniref:STM3941 family protein n=1 Tax=Miniphocaeibacter massiliensis TaxID=2041841 RepID=UPI000C0864D0|nr:STM3941 family protein [Miniphocaeibacter massiliensis]